MKLTNTLSGRKEEVKPLVDGRISMYACGVTVYDKCHLGHAMQAILYDVLARWLRFRGYEVTYVRNFTDVDDKIIARARELELSPLELSSRMIAASRRDMDALRVQPADHEPKVSDYIPDIIEFIENLIQKEYAYVTSSGDVYFRVRCKEDYGKLSGQNPDAMRTGARIDADPDKEDPLDFALWKSEDVEGAAWDSPFGKGRPGWHIECSVMSNCILGERFDIHGGGRDLVFPHHENEIAQSEARHGCGFASTWVHCGLLTIERQKMSKSTGNFITIEDALREYGVELIRWNLYQYHYASNIDFSDAAFRQGLKKLYSFYRTLSSVQRLSTAFPEFRAVPLPEYDPESFEKEFIEAMDDDLNLPRAMSTVHGWFQAMNEVLALKGLKQGRRIQGLLALKESLMEFLNLLEICQEDPESFFRDIHARWFARQGLKADWVDTLVKERNQARKSRDFARADQIRDELAVRGLRLLDTAEGTSWELSDQALEELVR